MQVCKGVIVRDSILNKAEQNEIMQILQSYTFSDTLDFYSFFMTDLSNGYRIFRNNKNNLYSTYNLAETSYKSIQKVIREAATAFKLNEAQESKVRFTIMPNDSQYKLHIDTSYKGVFILYCNPEWTIENEGELICYPDLKVEHTDFNRANLGKPVSQDRFAGTTGIAIAPINNRLVCISPGLPHRVTRSRFYKGVGRISLTGFFL